MDNCTTSPVADYKKRMTRIAVTGGAGRLGRSLVAGLAAQSVLANLFAGIQLAFSDGVLTLDAGSGDEAQASESIEATIEGEDITTGFNPAYLMAAVFGLILMGAMAALVLMLLKGADRAEAVMRGVTSHIPFVKEDTAARFIRQLVGRLEAGLRQIDLGSPPGRGRDLSRAARA